MSYPGKKLMPSNRHRQYISLTEVPYRLVEADEILAHSLRAGLFIWRFMRKRRAKRARKGIGAGPGRRPRSTPILLPLARESLNKRADRQATRTE